MICGTKTSIKGKAASFHNTSYADWDESFENIDHPGLATAPHFFALQKLIQWTSPDGSACSLP